MTKARELSNEAFLKATAATFREAWRMVEVLVQLNDAAPDGVVFVTKTQAEDVVLVRLISKATQPLIYLLGIECLRPTWMNTSMRK